MEYSRLDFDQYFTDTSNDWCGHTGKIVNQVNYKNVHYEYDGIEYDATYDVYEIAEADGYTWYKVAEDQWVADYLGQYVTYTPKE